MPLTASELSAFYDAPPPESDATPLLLSAMAALAKAPNINGEYDRLDIVGPDCERKQVPLPDEPWPELQLAEKYLKERAGVIKDLRQAIAMGGRARFEVDYSAGYTTLIPNVHEMRELVRILQLDAYVAGHRKDARAVADDIAGIVTLAHALEREPILISQLVRIALRGVAAMTLHRLYPTLAWRVADLERMQNAFAVESSAPLLQRCVAGERVMLLIALDDPAKLDIKPMPFHWPLLVAGHKLSVLKFCAAVDGISLLPWPTALSQMKAIENQLSTLRLRSNVRSALALRLTSFTACARRSDNACD